MAITNIHLAKHLNGTPVQPSDIKIGIVVDFPSGLGGVFSFRCIEHDEERALFSCIDPEWEREFTIEFNHPDLTKEEVLSIPAALKAVTGWSVTATNEHRALLFKASQLGYVSRLSQTQAHWTNVGIDIYKTTVGQE